MWGRSESDKIAVRFLTALSRVFLSEDNCQREHDASENARTRGCKILSERWGSRCRAGRHEGVLQTRMRGQMNFLFYDKIR
jgi:hypothetical protein